MDISRLGQLSEERREELLDRDAGIAAIKEDVESIIDRVRTDGDEALQEYAAEFDDVDQGTIDITDRAAVAYEQIDDQLRSAIETAGRNIREFHADQLPDDWTVTRDGRTIGRRFNPIDRVGVYVPGGTAAYPSSGLMGVIPAVVAGVDEVVVVTPPAEDPDPATLAAVYAAGADEVYAAGGAQGIAALAYGTETIAPVRKIVGPGNRWVTAAKAAVREDVAIDFLAGPSEILVIADDTATPEYVAADLIAQAEHDPHASVVAVTLSESMASAVTDAIDTQLPHRDRSDIIGEALDHAASGVFIAADHAAATTFAEAFAPEHLAIQTRDPSATAAAVPSAGSVFLGAMTPVAAGDYATGTNHVLPTNGDAHTHGGLAVETFLRASTVQQVDETGLESLREAIMTLAGVEGLEAHAASVDVRFTDAPGHRQD